MHVRIICEAPEPALPSLTIVAVGESSEGVAVRWATVTHSKIPRNRASNPTSNKQQQPCPVHAASRIARVARTREWRFGRIWNECNRFGRGERPAACDLRCPWRGRSAFESCGRGWGAEHDGARADVRTTGRLIELVKSTRQDALQRAQ